jgi:hypothetical protein
MIAKTPHHPQGQQNLWVWSNDHYQIWRIWGPWTMIA